jgi:hypothetical protein
MGNPFLLEIFVIRCRQRKDDGYAGHLLYPNGKAFAEPLSA